MILLQSNEEPLLKIPVTCNPFSCKTQIDRGRRRRIWATRAKVSAFRRSSARPKKRTSPGFLVPKSLRPSSPSLGNRREPLYRTEVSRKSHIGKFMGLARATSFRPLLWHGRREPIFLRCSALHCPAHILIFLGFSIMNFWQPFSISVSLLLFARHLSALIALYPSV